MGDIKDGVKAYFTLDKEIKEASGLLTQLRKKRKERETDILDWMRTNDKHKIKTKHGALERSIQSRKVTVNKERAGEVAAQYFGADEMRAEEYVRLLYDERPVKESEVLKQVKDDDIPAAATVDL